MKAVMLLHSGPLIDSQAVDEHGYVLPHKLVYGLDDGDLSTLKCALELTDLLSVCAWGAAPPQEAFQLALSHGAHQALFVGATDWPEQPATAAAALALRLALGQEFDLLITSDQGEQAILAAQVAAAAAIPYFNSLLSVTWQEGKLRLQRKLEKGERQVILTEPPAALAFLPQPSSAAPPDLTAQINAEAKPIINRNISYYDCLRRVGAGEAPAWQPALLNPTANAATLPLNNLPAEARLNYLLHGTFKARAGRRVKGSPQENAQAIIDYLLQEGLITEK